MAVMTSKKKSTFETQTEDETRISAEELQPVWTLLSDINFWKRAKSHQFDRGENRDVELAQSLATALVSRAKKFPGERCGLSLADFRTATVGLGGRRGPRSKNRGSKKRSSQYSVRTLGKRCKDLEYFLALALGPGHTDYQLKFNRPRDDDLRKKDDVFVELRKLLKPLPDDFKFMVDGPVTLTCLSIRKGTRDFSTLDVDSIVEPFGGSVFHLDTSAIDIVFEKGGHVQNALDALGAANRFVSMFEKIRIGIASGSGSVRALKHTLQVDGSSVQQARKLTECADKNTVIFDEHTYNLIKHLVECEYRSGSGYRAITRRAPWHELPLVGFEEELYLLRATKEHPAKSRSGYVFVTGTAGSGKSRLIQEFVNQESSAEDRPLFGYMQCRSELEPEYSDLLAPVIQSIRDLLEVSAVKGKYKDQIRTLFSTNRMLDLFGSTLREFATGNQLSACGRTDKLTEIVHIIDCLAKGSRNSIVLVVEDVHLADEATISVVQKLLQRITEGSLDILLVISGASELIDPRLDCFRTKATSIELPPLSRKMAKMLFKAWCKSLNVEAPNTNECDDVSSLSDVWNLVLAHTPKATALEKVRLFQDARSYLGNLDPASRLIVGLVSTFGWSCPEKWLMDVYRGVFLDAPAFGSIVEKLVVDGILRRRFVGENPELQFSGRKIFEEALKLSLTPRHTSLLADVLLKARSTSPIELKRFTLQAARVCEAVGRYSEAEQLLTESASRAIDSGAHEIAIGRIDRCLQFPRNDLAAASQLESHVLKVSALHKICPYHDARIVDTTKQIELILNGDTSKIDVDLQARGLRSLWSTAHNKGELEIAIKWAQKLLAVASQSTLVAEIESYHALIVSSLNRGRLEDVSTHYTTVVRRFRDVQVRHWSDHCPFVCISAQMALTYWLMGRTSEAMVLKKEAQVLALNECALTNAVIRNYRALIQLLEGNWPIAIKHANKAVEILSDKFTGRMPYWINMAAMIRDIALAHESDGRKRGSRTSAAIDCFRHWKERGVNMSTIWGCVIIQLLLRSRDYEKAIEILIDAKQVLQSGEEVMRGRLEYFDAMIQLQLNEDKPEAAIDLLLNSIRSSFQMHTHAFLKDALQQLSKLVPRTDMKKLVLQHMTLDRSVSDGDLVELIDRALDQPSNSDARQDVYTR